MNSAQLLQLLPPLPTHIKTWPRPILGRGTPTCKVDEGGKDPEAIMAKDFDITPFRPKAPEIFDADYKERNWQGEEAEIKLLKKKRGIASPASSTDSGVSMAPKEPILPSELLPYPDPFYKPPPQPQHQPCYMEPFPAPVPTFQPFQPFPPNKPYYVPSQQLPPPHVAHQDFNTQVPTFPLNKPYYVPSQQLPPPHVAHQDFNTQVPTFPLNKPYYVPSQQLPPPHVVHQDFNTQVPTFPPNKPYYVPSQQLPPPPVANQDFNALNTTMAPPSEMMLTNMAAALASLAPEYVGPNH